MSVCVCSDARIKWLLPETSNGWSMVRELLHWLASAAGELEPDSPERRAGRGLAMRRGATNRSMRMDVAMSRDIKVGLVSACLFVAGVASALGYKQWQEYRLDQAWHASLGQESGYLDGGSASENAVSHSELPNPGEATVADDQRRQLEREAGDANPSPPTRTSKFPRIRSIESAPTATQREPTLNDGKGPVRPSPLAPASDALGTEGVAGQPSIVAVSVDVNEPAGESPVRPANVPAQPINPADEPLPEFPPIFDTPGPPVRALPIPNTGVVSAEPPENETETSSSPQVMPPSPIAAPDASDPLGEPSVESPSAAKPPFSVVTGGSLAGTGARAPARIIAKPWAPERGGQPKAQLDPPILARSQGKNVGLRPAASVLKDPVSGKPTQSPVARSRPFEPRSTANAAKTAAPPPRGPSTDLTAAPVDTFVEPRNPRTLYAPVAGGTAESPPTRDVFVPVEAVASRHQTVAKSSFDAPTGGGARVPVVAYDVQSYLVLDGDHFNSIAQVKYRDANLGAALARYNWSNSPPDVPLEVGSRVRIPPRELLERRLEASGEPRFRSVASRSQTPLATSEPLDPPKVLNAAVPQQQKDVLAPAPSGAKTFTVTDRQTLYGIAKQALGDGRRWPEIFELNKDRLPNDVDVPIGTILRLPEASSAASTP